MSECKFFVEMISEYIDGVLTEEKQAELMAHIEKCESCRTRLEMMKLLSSEMSNMEEEVPDGFAESVMKKIRRENSPFLRVISSRSFIAATAAAAMLTITVGTISMNNGTKSDSAAPETMAVTYDAKLAPIESMIEESVEEEAADDAGITIMYSTNTSAAVTQGATLNSAQKSREEKADTFNGVTADAAAPELKQEAIELVLPEDISGLYKVIIVTTDDALPQPQELIEMKFDFMTDDYYGIIMDADMLDDAKTELKEYGMIVYDNPSDCPNISESSEKILLIYYKVR